MGIRAFLKSRFPPTRAVVNATLAFLADLLDLVVCELRGFRSAAIARHAKLGKTVYAERGIGRDMPRQKLINSSINFFTAVLYGRPRSPAHL
jgi:hypothetical protein